MTHTIKLAITLPKEEYVAIETLRKKTKETRSGMIRGALQHWFRCREQRQKINQYQENYQRYPEGSQEWEVLEAVQTSNLSQEDWS